MTPSKPTGIEALTVRRAKIADNDKVRYRVYSNPTEFIAVIAESALMAVKVAGINAPYKIMRDLPTEGIAIEAKRMATIDNVPERVRLSLDADRISEKTLKTEMPEPSDIRSEAFVPVGVADLRNKGVPRPRILSPDLLSEIIEQHAKTVVADAPAEPEVAPLPPIVSEPAPEAMDDAKGPTAEEQIIQAAREPSLEEKISALAEELLPETAAHGEILADNAAPALSQEEVENLLNAPQ